jgi:hypothetical protein
MIGFENPGKGPGHPVLVGNNKHLKINQYG